MKKEFIINNNQGIYFPLFNLLGLRGSITPFFGGDLSYGYNHYLLEPTTILSLYQLNMSRNLIFTINNERFYLNDQNDEIKLEITPFIQKTTKNNKYLKIETTSFVPVGDSLEVHEIKFFNHTNNDINIDLITMIPIFARSGENLRDHRHVTSLFNRASYEDNGIFIKPTLSFDENGHIKNEYYYSVFAYIENSKVNRVITNIFDFIGAGGFNNPLGISTKGINVKSGAEAIGAIGFEDIILKPNESKTLYLTIGIHQDKSQAIKRSHYYFNSKTFNEERLKVNDFFNNYIKSLNFSLVNDEITNLTKWITLQPVLRRYYGNSYLPHHDYGKGGRGWRDLWQDLLSLIMFNDNSVKNLLYNNFAGVRIDGSNATIIGDKPGEFKADRNNISRVWTDHGAWPLLTIKSYIDETNDLDFLFQKQTYFEDHFSHYTKKVKASFNLNNLLHNKAKPYYGTILEHLLVQNVTAYYNQGENGFLRLEDADWNDGLDMANKYGESISFSHFYANNLLIIADLIKHTESDIYIFKSLYNLIFNKINLDEYFDKVSLFDEEVVIVNKDLLIKELKDKYQSFVVKLKNKAWINNTHLQGYIKNDKNFLDNENTVNLTAQAMALLNQTVTNIEALSIKNKTRDSLFDENLGGYKLNSNYNDLLLNLGRAFGFYYGNKENGAVFSHMALMYIYGLYNYNFVNEGSEGYLTLFKKSLKEDSKLLAGIPEYFDHNGVGMYPYLTGSASWALKLLREQVFGIKMSYGKLSLIPKLTKDEFINHQAKITTYIKGKLINITYHNPKSLNYGQYKIIKVISNNQDITNDLNKIKENVEVYLDEV